MVDETNDLEGNTEAQAAEKMLSQSEVNSLVGRAKAEAQDKAKRQAEDEFNRRLQEMQNQKAHAESRGESTQEIDADKIFQQVQERLHQQQLEQQMQEVANAYNQKMSNGNKDYEDFDEVIKEFNPVEFPQIVYLVSGMDNAADVVYELSKNPSKLSTIDYLSHRSPQKAQAELQRIGKSIAENKAARQAEQQAQVDAPLDRMQPTSRTGSNGQMSVTDLRSQPWLRG